MDSYHFNEKPIILEGLFFVESQECLALFKSGSDKIFIGLGFVEIINKFKELSNWRVISWSVGRLINNGILK